MLETGDTVDRYLVDRLLGEGGMADVYRVRHRTLGTPAALKVLRMNGRHVQERLVLEGQVQAGLRHPNIVEVRDVLEVAGHPALLLELVEGPSLEGLLLKGRLPFDEAESIFRGILAAVEHAHTQGLVHRDLKPGNVLLAPRPGGGWVPKVADFGLARVVQDDDATLRKTRSGVAMGTPRYMSPEQIRDAKNVDQRTDIFALGAILYELVCGEAAFERSDIAAIFNATLSGSYKSPASLAPGVPERVLRAIDAALKTRKEARIPDCATFRAALDGVPYVATALPDPEGGERPADAPPPSRSTLVSAETIDPGPSVPQPARSAAPSIIGAAVVGGSVVAAAMVALLLVAGGLGWWFLGRAPAPAITEAAPSAEPVEVATTAGAVSDPGVATPASPTHAPSPSPSTSPAESTPPPISAAPAGTTPEKAASTGAGGAPAAPMPTVTAHAESPAATTEPPAAAPRTPVSTASTPAPSRPVEYDTVQENASTGARVSYSGDAVKVWLVSAAGRRVARGTVPAGRYDIEADFGDGVPTPAGELDLGAGDEAALKCSKAFKRCKR